MRHWSTRAISFFLSHLDEFIYFIKHEPVSFRYMSQIFFRYLRIQCVVARFFEDTHFE